MGRQLRCRLFLNFSILSWVTVDGLKLISIHRWFESDIGVPLHLSMLEDFCIFGIRNVHTTLGGLLYKKN